MNIDIERSVCFTGHRVLKNDFDIGVVREKIIELIEEGYVYFLNGMAIGFDIKVMRCMVELKKDYPNVKLIACVPCMNQEKNFNKEQKRLYYKMLEHADEKIYVSQEYTPECMIKRDRFMVDNSSVCVSYLYKAKGGAYYTTKYAVENEKKIIYIK